MDTVKIPLKIFTTYEALQEYYGDRNDLELGMYEDGDTLVVGHAPNAYSFNPQFFTGENNYVPDYIPASPITHMVTALSDNTAYGYTSGSGLYSEHTYATVKATAYDGYTFTNWSNGVETSAYTLLVENDVELTAYFEAGSQPTEPPTEPPTPTPTPTPTGESSYMYICQKCQPENDDNSQPTGRYYYPYRNGLLGNSGSTYGLESQTNNVYLIMDENAPNQILFSSNYPYETQEGEAQVVINEYYDIDTTNSELTITSYIVGEEDTHQLYTTTYTVNEYNGLYYNTENDIDFGCGAPTIPITTIWDQDAIESYMTTEMGATSFGSIELADFFTTTDYTTFVIPTAVCDSENELLYDEESANLVGELQNVVAPNLTSPDYVEGIYGWNTNVGIVDTENNIDSWEHTNDPAEAFAELDYVDYTTGTGINDIIPLWDIAGDYNSILMHTDGQYLAINLQIVDTTDGHTIDNVKIELQTFADPQPGDPKFAWQATSMNQSFTSGGESWETIADYLTDYGYSDVLDVNGNEFIEVNLEDVVYNTILELGDWDVEQLGDAEIMPYHGTPSTFTFVQQCTDEQSEYYNTKDYYITESDITGADDDYKTIVSEAMEFLNYNETCYVKCWGGAGQTTLTVSAHRTVAINE